MDVQRNIVVDDVLWKQLRLISDSLFICLSGLQPFSVAVMLDVSTTSRENMAISINRLASSASLIENMKQPLEAVFP